MQRCPFWLLSGLLLVVPLASTRAEVAKVAVVERLAEKKTGPTGAWHQTAPGAALETDDGLRTGRRSKADVRFTDGSLVRLGQLSSVQLKSARSVQLTGGRLLFAALKPGTVLAGTAAAEIKGSVALVTLHGDGTAEIALYSGALTVTTPQATLDLHPGQSVTAQPDGTLGQVRPAAPLRFLNGDLFPEFNDIPLDAPFAGSRRQRRERLDARRAALDDLLPGLLVVPGGEPFPIAAKRRAGAVPDPFPVPFPTAPAAVRAVAVRAAAPATGDEPGLKNTLPGLAPERRSHSVDPTLDTGAGNAHLEAVERDLGRLFGGDALLAGTLADDGSYGFGGRLGGFGERGRWRFEAALTPLYLRVQDDPGDDRNRSALSSLNATYRDAWGDVQIGRQRFVDGPVQATLYGSLLRPGGRQIMDAVRVAPDVGAGRTLQVAYLHDAFVRNLPFRVSGAQHGFMGRLGLERRCGNFGVNLLKYSDAPVAATTGGSFDFALPLARNRVELYGEVGRDPFRRRLTTVGLAFPGLYDRSGYDVYLEYTRLRPHDDTPAPPHELALRVYRRLNDRVRMVATASHFAHFDNRLSVALAVGARRGLGAGP